MDSSALSIALHVSLVGRKDLSGEIYRQVRAAILNGRLRPGDCLTPSRELARALAVSRSTVVAAYERLAAEGFVISRLGAGTFVSEGLAHAKRGTRKRPDGALRPRPIWESITLLSAFERPARFDFRTGLPDASLFPHATWRRLVARALRSAEQAGGTYQNPAGQSSLRAAIAHHIGISRGVEASADDIVVTSGTQQALDVLGRVLFSPGDRVAIEDPGYVPPRLLFSSLGVRVVGVPVDHDGLVVDALPSGVRVVYLTPSHQYPLGVTMTLPRRQALLAWAERNDAAIIEDDYDSEFRFEDRPLEPLQTLDRRGRVIYVGSFSKTLLPTLRIGFLVTPRSLRSAIHKATFVSHWHTPTLAQTALAHLIDDGDFARHIRRANRIYRERHAMLVKAISRDFDDHLRLIPSTTGLHVAALARTASVEQIASVANRAANAGVAIQTLSSFAMRGAGRAGVVLGYGGIATGQMQEGLRRLRRCFDD
jgi:GntR family transcriptional regulator/MocR family aminotransferase